MDKNIVRIVSKNKLLAVIVRSGFKEEGIKFLVPEGCPQQLGYMGRPRGYQIAPHIHKPALRQTRLSQEVLFIRRGKVRIDFYDGRKRYVESRIARQGDVVFLACGGHGFEFTEDAEIFEVKQGPFLKDMQPLKFTPVAKGKIKLRK